MLPVCSTHTRFRHFSLTDSEITRKSVHCGQRHANDFRVSLLHFIRHDIAINIHRGACRMSFGWTAIDVPRASSHER